MRILMLFAIGFAVACGLCAYGILIQWFLGCAVFFLLLSAAMLLISWLWEPGRFLAVISFGCSVGLLWFSLYASFYHSPVAAMDGEEAWLEFSAMDYSYDTTYGSAVDSSVIMDGKSYRARVYLDKPMDIKPGDTISGKFLLRSTSPKDRDQSMYYYVGEGMFFMAYQQEDITITSPEEVSWRFYPAILRMKLKSILQDSFPADVVPFTKALLLGDAYDLSYDVDTDLTISGIRHVVAVSGLHVSILYGFITFISGRKRFLTAILGLPTLLLFAAVAGFTPSVNRACMMIGLMMTASLLDREYDSATGLSFACLVMLVLNPFSVTSASLQLSVGCVAGILLFSNRIYTWLSSGFPNRRGLPGRLQNWFCSTVSVTFGAMSLTTPLSTLYFGTISLVSVLTNLVTLWIITLIFIGLILVCVLYLISVSAASFAAGLITWPIRFVLFAADILASFPLAAVYTRSIYIACWLVFFYLLLTVFLLQKKRKPLILILCAALSLCFALLLSWGEPLLDDTRITVLDVGQGQSILLQSEGRNYLVDCGGDSDTETADLVAETLLSQGIFRLDGMILTHNDRDHAGAAAYVLSRIKTDLLILTEEINSSEIAAAATGQVLYPRENLELKFGNTVLTVYAPDFTKSENENGLCVLFDTEKCDILITGDRSEKGEQALLKKMYNPKVDVLVAGHHGSRYATSEELLHAVQPETVIISVGEGNSYGHPAPELLERLRNYGCQIYRTDLDGTVIIRR